MKQKKLSVFVFLFFMIGFCLESTNKSNDRPPNIPKEAVFQPDAFDDSELHRAPTQEEIDKSKRWRLDKLKTEGTYFSWYPNGKVENEIFRSKDGTMDFEIHYSESGYKMVNQRKMLEAEPNENLDDRYFQRVRFAIVGKEFFYHPTGYLSVTSCSYRGIECGETIVYNADGSISEKVKHEIECKDGCGLFRPFLELGKYKVNDNKVRLREKPSTKDKIVKELQKNELVDVTYDTKKIETIGENTFPWVKVKTGEGKEGFVFGAFLERVEGKQRKKN